MKIVVDLDPDTYERIKQFVVNGEYESVEQFLRASADNQLTIEAGGGSTLSAEPEATRASAAAPSAETGEKPAISEAPTEEFTWGLGLPETVPTRAPFPIDRSEILLFSQYYRFLPLKFVLHRLAVESASADESLTLETFRDHVSEAVLPVRDSIHQWETRENIPKGERFSTAFPKQDVSDPARTMRRYLNHYVGRYQPRNESPSGFGHDLEFVSIEVSNNVVTIQLTEAGLAFTRLPNPVLEHGPEAADARLSDDEQAFLVTHIRETMDLEYEFMEFVYDTLEHHDQTYTQLMGRFRSFLENTPEFSSDASVNQIRSHTAGTISRMVSLGILTRGSRRGVYETVRPLTAYRKPTNPPTDTANNESQ